MEPDADTASGSIFLIQSRLQKKYKIIFFIDKRMEMLYNSFCIWPETGRGEMSEWLKEPVLKTGDVEASVGSNPTLSATLFICQIHSARRSTQVAEGAPLLRE